MAKRLLGILMLGLFALNAGVVSAKLTKGEYKTAKDVIDAALKADRERCGSFSGNAKDICIAEAKGKHKVAVADLDARDRTTRKARQAAREVRAHADYAVAKEKCDDKAGHAKSVCVKEAKAGRTAAMADARADRQAADARANSDQVVSKVLTKEDERILEARKAAADEKREADYGVAREKCEKFAGEARTRCLDDAKVRFGKR